jgi:radical SAM protein with 4Fe4S-binding SPASM domain
MPLPQPHNAIVAVTLNCNARCTMCDIWQNDMHGEAGPEVFGRLPTSLRDINISGGEPFLRSDLPQILEAIKTRNPKARLVISTNGFQPGKTRRMLPDLLAVDRRLAVRVSIDGLDGTHDEIRGIPNGFQKCVETLELAREAGVQDLGIGFTLLERNVHELADLHAFAEARKLQLSVTVALDSSIYFGGGKQAMRPHDSHAVRQAFSKVIDVQLRKWDLKENFRGWFNRTLLEYHESNRRPFTCDGGSGFFYMDSFGDVYLCHILNVKIGNLGSQSWDELWGSKEADEARGIAATCDKCWLVCTGKAQIWEHKWRVGAEILRDKLGAHLRPGR